MQRLAVRWTRFRLGSRLDRRSVGTIVDGNALSRSLREETAAEISELTAAGHPQPTIAIVQAAGEEAAGGKRR